jgi:uncharacterized protein YhaN
VRLHALRVDGYGVLADLEVGDLPPGLTVIYGPNEAGKSTLLDFVRGVLFGFPSRRANPTRHEPLRGGRHGGALELSDENGARYLLERYSDAKGFVLTCPDGALGDEECLHRLLGGADDALFRSIFAFGLGELASFETLERDEVRELVFSAGVLGAGRSAARAARSLEQARLAIVRPRQQDAPATRLRRRIDEIDQALREARRRATGYGDHDLEHDRLVRAVEEERQRANDLHRARGELDRLVSCWPIWRRSCEVADRLAELGPLAATTGRLTTLGARIDELAAQLSGHDERVRRARELAGQLSSIETRLALCADEIGAAAAAGRAVDIGLEDRARTMAEEFQRREAEFRALEDEVLRAREEHAVASAIHMRSEPAHPLREEDELVTASRELRQLRQLLDDRRATRLAAAASSRETALAASPRPARPGLFAIATAVVVLLATSVATAAIERRALGLGLAALACGIAALVGALVRYRRRDVVVATPAAHQEEELAAMNRAIARLSAALCLDSDPTGADLAALEERLDAERRERHHLDELAARETDARDRLESAARRLARADEAMRDLAGRVAGEARTVGLPYGLSPKGLLDAIATVRRARDLDAAKGRVLEELGVLEEAIGSFEHELGAVCDDLTTAGIDGLGSGGVAPRVARLVELLGEARTAERERRELERSLEEGERDLLEALGGDIHGTRLRAELATGAVLEWEEGRRRLDEEIEQSDAAYTAALAAENDAARALETLRATDEIAALELERENLETELDAALARWTVLGLAKSLLEETLRQYERERQPLVIARATELFSELTDGHYVQLVAREDDGGHGHGIEVITASGTRLDSALLSRGTAEQLYLCLRLAFATTFAERAVSLPLVLDDVLVNFDPQRATAVARAIATTATSHQVLAFTCHPHVVDYFRAVESTSTLVELPRYGVAV